jgi:hypothetical protein
VVFVEVQLHEGIAARSDGGGCVFHDAKFRQPEGMRLKMTSLLNRGISEIPGSNVHSYRKTMERPPDLWLFAHL